MTIQKTSLICAVALLLLTGCGYDLGLDRRMFEARFNPPDPRHNIKPKKHPHFALEYQKIALPPAQYDHVYDGKLDLRRAAGAEMNELCANVRRQHGGGQVLGCTFANAPLKQCTVYIINDDELDLAGWDYDVIWRHERGHCNGGHHDVEGHWH